MSWSSKVVWSEGLFLRPQHFQQETRYLERYVEQRSGDLRVYSWGFTELKVDPDLLRIGKVGLLSARGVLPDGSPFDIPDHDTAPDPIEIDENTRDTLLYLCVPVRRETGLAIAERDDPDALPRHVITEHEARDGSARSEATALMQVGSLNVRLLLEHEERADYACLGVLRIVECRIDKQVLVDDTYIPPFLDVQGHPRLVSFLNELHGLVQHRTDALAGRVSQSGKGGAAEVSDFMMLQLVNRYSPLLAHLANVPGLHPEEAFRVFLQLAGELSTFTAAEQRPGQMPSYKHEDLKLTFEPVMALIRDSLSMVLEQTAIPIPIKERQHGMRTAQVADPTLFESATFVLAVSSALPVEELQMRFPQQVKIGSVEKIRDLVNLALPGIAVRPLPAAPRQIPFHAGNTYFELDSSSPLWAGLATSGGFAMFVGGEFPELRMEFWAIRG